MADVLRLSRRARMVCQLRSSHVFTAPSSHTLGSNDAHRSYTGFVVLETVSLSSVDVVSLRNTQIFTVDNEEEGLMMSEEK